MKRPTSKVSKSAKHGTSTNYSRFPPFISIHRRSTCVPRPPRRGLFRIFSNQPCHEDLVASTVTMTGSRNNTPNTTRTTVHHRTHRHLDIYGRVCITTHAFPALEKPRNDNEHRPRACAAPSPDHLTRCFPRIVLSAIRSWSARDKSAHTTHLPSTRHTTITAPPRNRKSRSPSLPTSRKNQSASYLQPHADEACDRPSRVGDSHEPFDTMLSLYRTFGNKKLERATSQVQRTESFDGQDRILYNTDIDE